MPLEITDLITPQRIIPSLRASDKPSLLREISERAGRLIGLDGASILQAIQSREALGSTGVGRGIALPHARITGLARFFGLFIRLERPIPFEAIENRPVDLVFMLLVPGDAGDDYLTALASISRHLRQPYVTDAIRSAKTTAELFALLSGS